MSLRDLFRRCDYTDLACLFSVSTGRCGTLTLIELLNLSPSFTAVHEAKPMLRRLQQETFEQGWRQTERYCHVFRRARGRVLRKAVASGTLYAESTILKFFVPAIAEVLPRARFLHMYRHPGGVVRSGMRRDWYTGRHKFDRTRLRPGRDDRHYAAWDGWGPFEKTCWYWDAVNRYMLDCAERLGADRVVGLKFEDFIRQETGVYRIPFDLLQAPLPSAHAVSEVLGRKENAQVDGGFPRFRDWSEEQRARLYDIAGDTMRRLGYEG